MGFSGFANDADVRQILSGFINEMIKEQGFSFEEAYAVVHGEIKREYDQRIKERRASFRLIQAPGEIGLKAKGKS